MNPSRWPDGLSPPHLEAPAPVRRHASPLSVILLGGLLLAALLGTFGGGEPPTLVLAGEGAELAVTGPQVLRNGEFFETAVVITPRSDAADLTLALDATLLRDLTQNSMLPAAAEEGFEAGAFRFHYGPVKAGEVLEIKMDFQINPALLGGTRGDIAAFDGSRELARLPYRIEVRP